MLTKLIGGCVLPGVEGTVETPAANPVGGAFTVGQSVTLSTGTAGASIRYTTDGSTPTESVGTVYSGAISITQTTTLKAIAYKTNWNNSGVMTEVYTLTVVLPVAAPAGGGYSVGQSVTLSTTTSGASIRYTTDGSTPSDVAGTLYSGAIAIDVSTTLKFIAYKAGWSNSAVVTETYTLTVVAPTASPVAGSYNGAQDITLSTTTSGASIRYTTDGSTPSESVGTIYSAPFEVASSLTVKAIAYKTGWTNSSVLTAAYTIDLGGGWDSYMDPTGTVTTNSWNLSPAGGSLHQKIDDGASLDSGDYIVRGGNNVTDTCSTSSDNWNPARTATRIVVETNCAGAPTGVTVTLKVSLYLAGAWQTDVTLFSSSSSSPQDERPATFDGSWSAADLDALQVRYTAVIGSGAGGGNVTVYRCRVKLPQNYWLYA